MVSVMSAEPDASKLLMGSRRPASRQSTMCLPQNTAPSAALVNFGDPCSSCNVRGSSFLSSPCLPMDASDLGLADCVCHSAPPARADTSPRSSAVATRTPARVRLVVHRAAAPATAAAPTAAAEAKVTTQQQRPAVQWRIQHACPQEEPAARVFPAPVDPFSFSFLFQTPLPFPIPFARGWSSLSAPSILCPA